MANSNANVTGTFVATGQSASFTPVFQAGTMGRFNLSLWVTFVATVQLERSFDNGTTWLPCTMLGTTVTFTTPLTECIEEIEAGVIYRLNCTAYTSGTVNYRISQ